MLINFGYPISTSKIDRRIGTVSRLTKSPLAIPSARAAPRIIARGRARGAGAARVAAAMLLLSSGAAF